MKTKNVHSRYRFSIGSLLVLTGLVAILIGASKSSAKLRAVALERKQEVNQILFDIYPEVTKRLLEEFELKVENKEAFADYLASYPPSKNNAFYFRSGSPYGSPGNGRSGQMGPPLLGPTIFSRRVRLEMILSSTDFASTPAGAARTEERVSIDIEHRVKVLQFGGLPQTTIYDNGASLNSVFLELFEEKLRAADIEFKRVSVKEL